MRLILRLASFLLLVLLVAAWPTSSVAGSAAATEDLGGFARRVLDLTNQERLKASLLPVRWNDPLSAAAVAYAQDMAARNYFAHNSPEGTTPVDRARQAGYEAYGWGGLFVGENLARGHTTPEAVLQGWMASDGHRANILNSKYRELGVGVAVTPGGSKVWSQEFGSRPKVLPVFINGGASATDSPQVTLFVTSEEVSSWGSVGTLVEMMVSNRPDFAGSSWEPYSRTKGWTLNGEPGPQRVYVRLRDASGATVDSSEQIQYTGRRMVITYQAQSQPQTAPGFKLGFKSLADQISSVVGDALENEHPAPNGDALQQTSRGLMVWRKADNWTAFTNGSLTWVNGPFGIQQRANGARFTWEAR